jgi:DNA-binding protein YbaB
MFNNPLKGLGDMAKLQQQASKMQDLLKKEEVVVEKYGVKVIVRGDQHVKEVYIDGVIENRVADAINDAVKKTQEIAAKKFMEIQNQ